MSGPGDGTFTIAIDSVNATDGCPDSATISSGFGVTPSSFAYVERVWGFRPCQGDSVGNDGTDQAQTLNIVSSGAWSITSDNWLQVTPSSGGGNATVTVSLRNLYRSSLPLTTNLPTRIKSGTYSGSVTVSPRQDHP